MVAATTGKLFATRVAELDEPAACRVISADGMGDPSRLRDAGVIRPDMPTWFGDDGALRL